MNIMALVVLASSLWMASDAAKIGYDKRDIRGIAAMGPLGWFVAGLLLWFIAFPLYLIKRPELMAAAERKRLGVSGPAGMLQPPGYPPPGYPPTGYPPTGYPPTGYPPPGYPQPGHPQPGYPQPGYPQQGYPQQAPPQAPQQTATLGLDEVADAIVKLGEMRQAGLLTDAEFEQQKAQVLGRMG